jgi:PadR family transcriptional regulator, regulatory protein PadR
MKMKQQNDLAKGSIDSLLLCLIGQQPLYGYQIIKELEEKSQGYFKYKEGTLYPALHRLEKAGLLKGKWEPTASGRQRRYYHITDKGKGTLAEKKAQWLDFLSAMNMIIRPAMT